MLKKRLIPKLLFKVKESFSGKKPLLVTTKEFNSIKPTGDPISQAKIFESQLADELVFLNIDRNKDSWLIFLETINEIANSLTTPLAVGGGIKDFEQVQQLLDRGADKIIINTAAIDKPDLIEEIAASYGSQCVVLSIDVRQNNNLQYIAWSECGKKNSHIDALDWAAEAINRGAGEILLTSIERDGSGLGLDNNLIRNFSDNLNVPIIASGGCGLSSHFVEGYESGASAVSAGTFFFQRDQNPMQCRSHIYNSGINIRIEV